MSARYRCRNCGNLTRFDVTVTRRTREYHHFSVGGDLEVEDRELLAEVVEEVACRWCAASGEAVEIVSTDVSIDEIPVGDAPDEASRGPLRERVGEP
jgi:hypothetical protein